MILHRRWTFGLRLHRLAAASLSNSLQQTRLPCLEGRGIIQANRSLSSTVPKLADAPRVGVTDGKITVTDTGIFDPYIPKDPSLSKISPEYWKSLYKRWQGAVKSKDAIKRIMTSDKSFRMDDFKVTAWNIYTSVNSAFAKQNMETLRDLCAPQTSGQLQKALQSRPKNEIHVWELADSSNTDTTALQGSEISIVRPEVKFKQARAYPVKLMYGKKIEYPFYSQITLEFIYSRYIYIYELDGSGSKKKVLAGSDMVPQKLSELCVFQKELYKQDDHWRYLARIATP